MMTTDNRIMTLKERYLLFRSTNKNKEVDELLNLMEQVEENPTSVGIKSLEKRLVDLKEDLDSLDEDDKELIERLSHHVLFTAKKTSQDITRWDFFVETAKKNEWEPVLEMIELLEENEKRSEELRTSSEVISEKKMLEYQELEKKDYESLEIMMTEVVMPWAKENVSLYYHDLIERTLQNKLRTIQNRLKRNTDLAFADWLRNTRKAKKMTLQDVADKSNTSVSYIQRLEKGRRKVPSLPIVQSIAKAVNVPIQDVLAIIHGDEETDQSKAPDLFTKILNERYSISGRNIDVKVKHLIAELLRASLNENNKDPMDNIIELPNIARRLQIMIEKAEQEDMSDDTL